MSDKVKSDAEEVFLLRKSIAEDLDPEEGWGGEHSELHDVALILSAAFYVGPSAEAIRKFTILPEALVREVVGRFEVNGVFREGKFIRVDWLKDNGDVEVLPFWLDVMVGAGQIRRGQDKGEELTYQFVEGPAPVPAPDTRKERRDFLLRKWDNPRDHDYMTAEEVAEMQKLIDELGMYGGGNA